MKYKLIDLIDIDQTQPILESFTEMTGLVTAILDLEGDILSHTGWMDICTKFHRAHTQTALQCRESDTVLAAKLRAGDKYNVYRCLNGLVDVAVPIVVADQHIGNFFTGQFFFEPPDREDFRRQAAQYGFDEAAYLEALDKVPVVSERQIEKNMVFLVQLTELLAEMGLAGLMQKELTESLRINEAKYRSLISSMSAGFALHEIICDQSGTVVDYRFLEVNETFERMTGMKVAAIIGKTVLEVLPQTEKDWIQRYGQVALTDQPIHFEDYSRELDTYFEVIAYSPRKKQFAVIFSDITERRRVEQELNEHREGLEIAVNERTADLQTVINAMSGREVRMAELKDEIKRLQVLLDQAGIAT
jgi:PAS domain S-box-containing protein